MYECYNKLESNKEEYKEENEYKYISYYDLYIKKGIAGINKMELSKEYIGHKHSIRTLCKINEDTFASGSFDGTIKIWNLNEKEAIQSLEGHKSYVISVIQIKNGDLVSCSNDHTIKIWRNI